MNLLKELNMWKEVFNVFDLLKNSQAMQNAEESISFESNIKPIARNSKKEKAVTEIPLSRIKRFTDSDGKEQPYRIDEEELEQLIISIEDEGLLHPILVREINENEFQVLSGHKRAVAFQRLNKSVIPSIVMTNLTDNEAYMMMAEANIQRKNTKPSEIGKILTKYIDMKKVEEKITVEKICQKFNIAKKSYYRYIYLVTLVNELQTLCDEERFSTNAVEDTKVLPPNQQRVVADFIKSYSIKTYTERYAKATLELFHEKSDFSKEDMYVLFFAAPKDDEEQGDEIQEENPATMTTIYYQLCKEFPEKLKNKSSTDIDEIILNAVRKYFKT